MATLTVWKFDSEGGAQLALDLLERLQKEELIRINDAAYVYWPTGRKKPKTEQLHSLTGAGALGGSFWGLLFGLIFWGWRWGQPWGRSPARCPTSASTTTSSVGSGTT